MMMRVLPMSFNYQSEIGIYSLVQSTNPFARLSPFFFLSLSSQDKTRQSPSVQSRKARREGEGERRFSRPVRTFDCNDTVHLPSFIYKDARSFIIIRFDSRKETRREENRTFFDYRYSIIRPITTMQPVSPGFVQTRYPPPFQQHFPVGARASPQSLKSIDANVFGPSAPPIKHPKKSHSQQHSSDVDLRRLILYNLPIDLIQEYLELYLEYLSGETEIERIDYSNLEDTTVMVTFKTELGPYWQTLCNRQSILRSLSLLFRYGRSSTSPCQSIQTEQFGDLTCRRDTTGHGNDTQSTHGYLSRRAGVVLFQSSSQRWRTRHQCHPWSWASTCSGDIRRLQG